MASALNFSLPEGPPRRARVGFLQVMTLLAVIGVAALVVVKDRRVPVAAPSESREAEKTRLQRLGEDLERRTLYAQAGEVWGELASLPGLSEDEKGGLMYRRGKCLKLAGRYAEASRRLSEVEGFPLSQEEKRKARQLLLECLEALGKRDVRDRLAESLAMGQAQEKDTVLALVRDEAITKEALRERLVEDARQMLVTTAALTPEEAERKASEVADRQLSSPETSKQILQQAISARLLYREGLERGFGDDETLARAAARFREAFVAGRVIEEEVAKALKGLGPTELSNHYEAHKDRFVQKAGVEFSFARFPGAAEGEMAIETLKDPARRGGVKLEKGAGVASEGEPVPGIGPSAEIAAHLLALAEGEVSARPVENDGVFYVFRAEKKTPEKQLSFKEAEGRVRSDLAQAKRQEALQALTKSLAEKFPVTVPDAGGPAPGASSGPSDKAEGAEKAAQGSKSDKGAAPAGATEKAAQDKVGGAGSPQK